MHTNFLTTRIISLFYCYSTIFIGIQKVRVTTTPPLLGVNLDRSLTFNAHLKKLTTSCLL